MHANLFLLVLLEIKPKTVYSKKARTLSNTKILKIYINMVNTTMNLQQKCVQDNKHA